MEVSTMGMPKPLTVHQVDPLIVEAWVTGWVRGSFTCCLLVNDYFEAACLSLPGRGCVKTH
jgi:hypothetical protein